MLLLSSKYSSSESLRAQHHGFRRFLLVARPGQGFAIVQLGMANSRMKDVYDLGELARSFEFIGQFLVRAIEATFRRGRTPLPTDLPVALAPAFTRAA